MTEPDETTIRLRAVFVDLLDLPDDIGWDTVRYQVTPEWDSLVHMAIVASIEQAFDVRLDDEDIMAIDDVDGAEAIVRARLAGSGHAATPAAH